MCTPLHGTGNQVALKTVKKNRQKSTDEGEDQSFGFFYGKSIIQIYYLEKGKATRIRVIYRFDANLKIKHPSLARKFFFINTTRWLTNSSPAFYG